MENFEKIDILLVDDRVENLISFDAVLAGQEYNLIKASSGDEALRYLLDNTPALILMDVQMPGLNGFETASMIKSSKRTREIPIIFITAINKDEQFVHKGYEHGAVDYIYKPYDALVLKSKVSVFAEMRKQHARMARFVSAQRATTEALADSTEVNEAVFQVLKAICRSLGWDTGTFWKLDRFTEQLEWHSTWPTSLSPPYLPCKPQEPFRSIWTSGDRTTVEVPVAVHTELFGVLEFESLRKINEDPDLMKVMEAIGSQVAQVLKRAETFFQDIEQRKKREENASFLLEATSALSSSLDYDEAISAFAQVAVKSLADWCTVHVIEDQRQPRLVALAESEPGPFEELRNFLAKCETIGAIPTGTTLVLSSGKSEFYPQSAKHIFSGMPISIDGFLGQKLDMRSGIVVPLKMRGYVFGAITLISSRSGRRYSPEDLVLAEELGRRTAICIDNARLYREAQDALRGRDEFFSIASHELKTPLASLKLNLQMIQRGLNSKREDPYPLEKMNAMLDSALRQMGQLNRLVDDLLDVVRIQEGKLRIKLDETNLSDLVKDVTDRYRGPLKSVQCELEQEIQSQILGRWDHTRIEQVVVNLLSNVIKYAPGKPVQVKLQQDKNVARIVVRDFGPGIPENLQTKIFHRFERAVASENVSGLGLGLFIVKQIVEAHGGRVQIESQPGQGSTFMIDLPTN